MAAEALDVGTQLAGLKSLLTTPGPVILEVCINPFFAPGHEWCALPVTGAGGAEGHPPAATPAAVTASSSRAVLLLAASGSRVGRVAHTVQG